jgi:hypothetical protein
MLKRSTMEGSMSRRVQSDDPANSPAKKPKRETKTKPQVDMFALLLEVQAIALMINDVRSRLSQIEKHLGIDHMTQSERATLSNLDGAI